LKLEVLRFDQLRPAKVLAALRAFRIGRHHVRRATLIAGALVGFVLLFALGAIGRLAMGPVSLGPFSTQLRESIVHALPGLGVRYDEAALEWSRDEGRVNLIILGARVVDADQHIIAQAPKAEIGLAVIPLLQGDIQVKRIALVGVQLTLVRTADGTLRLGVERDRTGSDVLERIREAIEKSGNGATSLESFAVRKARLAFYDEPTGLFVVAPQAKLEIRMGREGASRSASPVEANVDADVEITGRPAHLTGTVRLPRNGGPVSGALSISGLELQALAQNSKTFTFLEPFDLKIDLTGSFIVEHGNRLRSADLGIGASGIVGGLGSPLVVKSLRFVGRYDGATGRLLVDDATLQGVNASAHLQGQGNLEFSGNAVTRASLDLTADKIALKIPNAFQQSVELGRIALRGTYTTADRTLTLDRLLMGGSPVAGELSGRIVLADNTSPEIDLTGRIDELSVRDLVHYWPLRVGDGARSWIARSMPAGRVGPIAIRTAIKPGALDGSGLPDDALLMTLPITGATVDYIHGMTPITQASGTATLTGDTFKAAIAGARIGPLIVKSGHVEIPNLHVHGTAAQIAAHVSGRLRDVLSLIDLKPLQYPTRFHIKPAETGGAVELDASFKVPTLKNLSIDDVGIGIKASVAGLALNLGERIKISNGTTNFEIDNSHLHTWGNIDLGRTRMAADWVEQFKAANDITTKISLRGVLDDDARAALNFRAGDLLTGSVPISAQLEGHRGSLRRAQMTMDLTPTTLGVDLLNFHKPAGTTASAQVTARFGANGDIGAEDIVISGNDLSARGTLNFNKDGGIGHLEFPSFKAGANDFAIGVSQASGGGYEIALKGRSADGTAIGRRSSNSASSASDKSSEGETPLHLVAHLDRVSLRNGVQLSPFALDANVVGSRLQSLSLTAGLAKPNDLTATVTPTDAGRRLTMNAGDAGQLLKGFFGFGSVTGGRIQVAGTLAPAKRDAKAEYWGTIDIRDFRVQNQPFLARLFSAGSLGGMLDLMRNQGIAIDRLEVPFRGHGDIIDIREAHASGPSIGFSTEGYVDRRANQLQLRGAVAPLYGINGFLGAIPVLGSVLTSKKGEGIIGVTYTLSGNIDEPKVSVNPLSMLTPGIFRRIFEGKAPSAPPEQADSGPAKPNPTP
jgi:hypothetical protein